MVLNIIIRFWIRIGLEVISLVVKHSINLDRYDEENKTSVHEIR